MRVEIPGPAGHWVEIRDVSELLGADEERWRAPIAGAQERQMEENANAPDGAPPAPLRMPPGWVKKRADDLLASLVTDWSYAAPDATPHIPLPYSPDARLKLPLAALHALREAAEPHMNALNGDSGPKEPEAKTSTTNGSGSSSDSKEKSESGPLDSAPAALATASS